jgi:murein L,D-transpeptidase YcbB/YkuD
MNSRYGIKGFIGLLVLGLTACHSGPSPAASKNTDSIALKRMPAADTALAGSFSSQSALRFDSTLLDTFFTRYPTLSVYAGDVRQFYRARSDAFAWYDAKGQIEQAGHLYNKINNLSGEGINTRAPYIRSLDTLMENIDKVNPSSMVRTELLLTSMYFYFAQRAWAGLEESKTKKIEWFLPRKKISYGDWLQSYLNTPDSGMVAKEPVYRQYFLLKEYLHRYIRILQQNDWKPLSMEKSSYRAADSAALLKDIRKRLQALGDSPGTDTGCLYDAGMEQAIKNFQHRLGMKEDGIITRLVLSELNTPIQKRISQILVNMERSRWLPDTVRGDYLAINIPEFKLHIYRDDSLLWDMKVIVGRSVYKTVIFSGTMKNIVFSPYWNVPPGILKKEVLPGIKTNKNYLATHHMEMDGNGGVRQKPGPWNSLGGVKFLFPNSHAIYLHDTPAKSLFGENDRAFSHGCIRLGEPAKLAAYLLRNDRAWDPEKIAKAMHTGKEKWVTLKEDVRVFIVYFTAWVDRQGHLNFRKDIYARDKRLETMLN